MKGWHVNTRYPKAFVTSKRCLAALQQKGTIGAGPDQEECLGDTQSVVCTYNVRYDYLVSN